MSPLDDSRHYKDAHSKKIVRPLITSFSDSENDSGETGIRDNHVVQIESVPIGEHLHTRIEDTQRFELLYTSIDQIPTQTELQVIYKSSPSMIIGGLPIDEQPTWIVPVVQIVRRVPELKARESDAQNYISLIHDLAKSSGIYAIASLVSPLISLVLAPFLTRSLSRADYGALAVLNTIIALVAGVTQLGLGSAFFRAYSCDYESQRDRLAVISTVIILLSVTSIFTVSTVIMISPWLAELLFNSPSFGASLRIAALVILLQNFTVPGFARLRAENRAGFFSLLSIVNLLVVLGTTVVLVGLFHMGMDGALLATGGGYGVIVAYTLPVNLLHARLHFRFDIARNLLSFGFPLVFNFVSLWVLQLSDRYLLSRLGSLTQTASYAVAYSLGGVLSVVVVSPFVLAWPAAMFAIAKRDDAARVFQLLFRWFSIILLFAAYACSLISMGVLVIFFPPAYHSAALVIPIVSASIMFFGVYNVFSVGVGVRRKTWFTVIFATLAALVNVGFNIILIPLYGSMGAAASTLIAYAFLALISYVVNQRIYPVPFEIGKFMISLSVGIVLFVGGGLLAQAQETCVAWGILIGTLGVYGGYLLLFGKLPRRRDEYKDKQKKEIS